MKEYTTDRLILRSLTPADIHEIYSTLPEDAIMRFFGFKEADYLHYKNMHEKGMETHRISLHVFVVVRKSDGTPMGECGFHTWNKTHRRAELFYMLRDDSFKRQGYMTEALRFMLRYGFTEMGLHRIEAKAAPDNEASLALLRKYGFTYEGITREDYVVNGKNEDSVCYSLLKWEWEASSRKN